MMTVKLSPCQVCMTIFERKGSARFCSTICRFTAKVVVEDDGCWSWVSAKKSGWYGRFCMDSNRTSVIPAHRAAYELFVEPIPAGMHIDHLCRNICCVNPDHLEPVTPRENVLRGIRSRTTTL